MDGCVMVTCSLSQPSELVGGDGDGDEGDNFPRQLSGASAPLGKLSRRLCQRYSQRRGDIMMIANVNQHKRGTRY